MLVQVLQRTNVVSVDAVVSTVPVELQVESLLGSMIHLKLIAAILTVRRRVEEAGGSVKVDTPDPFDELPPSMSPAGGDQLRSNHGGGSRQRHSRG